MADKEDINYWFIRLGGKGESERPNREQYQAFAEEENLVKIGYGIDEDLTQTCFKDENDLKEHLRGNGVNNRVISLITYFIHGIKNDDIIICSFDDGYMKAGRVVEECGTIESFFESRKQELEQFLKKYPGTEDQKEQRVKPAVKVKWIAEKISHNQFPAILQDELTKYMPAAVNKLKLSNSNAPIEFAIIKLAKAEKAKADLAEAEENNADDIEAKRAEKDEAEADYKNTAESITESAWISKVSEAATRTGVYAAILSAILSLLFSKIFNSFVKGIYEWKLIAIFSIIVVTVVSLGLLVNSKLWKDFWSNAGKEEKI